MGGLGSTLVSPGVTWSTQVGVSDSHGANAEAVRGLGVPEGSHVGVIVELWGIHDVAMVEPWGSMGIYCEQL